MEDNEELLSKYSTGVSINIRVDQLWKDTHTHSRNGKYNDWNLDLDCIWSELARDLKEKEDIINKLKSFQEIEEEFNKFDEDILENGRINDKEPEGFRQMTESEIKARNEHYKILRKKQLFLARLENKLGKGTTWNTNEDDEVN